MRAHEYAMLRVLRARGMRFSLCGFAYSTYATSILQGTLRLLQRLLLLVICEMRLQFCVSKAHLTATQYIGHIGFPPHECADVTADMGRTNFTVPSNIEELMTCVKVAPALPDEAVVLSLQAVRLWACLAEMLDPTTEDIPARLHDLLKGVLVNLAL